jgi:TM2 domain-containing membrane protein YozV
MMNQKRITVEMDKTNPLGKKVSPVIALLLSLVLPGAGMIYARNFMGGLLLMAVTLLLGFLYLAIGGFTLSFIGENVASYYILYLAGILLGMLYIANAVLSFLAARNRNRAIDSHLNVTEADKVRKYTEKLKRETQDTLPEKDRNDYRSPWEK